MALYLCADCHTIDERGTGAVLAIAPSFPDIAAKPEATAPYLRKWLTASHTRMPKMQLSARDKDDLVLYIMSLRPRAR